MTRKANPIPSYLLHKQSGQARVRINGRDVLLGEYNSPESRIRYGEVVAKLAGGQSIEIASRISFRGRNRGRAAVESDPGPTVGEICLAFLNHAEKHYLKNGKPTSEIWVLKSCIRPLNELFGLTPVSEFGPLAAKAVRQRMIEAGWKRTVINANMSRIRRVFKFAVENELCGPEVLQRLQAVAPLLAGRTEAPDGQPRRPVSDDSLERVRERVSPLIRDLIDLQNCCGARSGELLSLRGDLIDRTAGDVWVARLDDHKTAHHGALRELAFGPQAQAILKRYLTADMKQPLFPITGAGYRRAITRACDAAGIPRWVPHALRHTFATRARSEAGLEAAQAALGHRKADMTEHYAAAARSKAVEVARRIG
jgi:integrase